MSTSLSSYTVILVNGRQPRASGARKFQATRVSTRRTRSGIPARWPAGRHRLEDPAPGRARTAPPARTAPRGPSSRQTSWEQTSSRRRGRAARGGRRRRSPGRGSPHRSVAVTGASAQTREHAAATPPGVGRLERDRRLGQIGPGMSGQSESKLRPVAGITPRLQPAAVQPRVLEGASPSPIPDPSGPSPSRVRTPEAVENQGSLPGRSPTPWSRTATATASSSARIGR